MTTDDEQIRTLIRRWAEAVDDGDLDGVLADHDDDIVMFDVPPPYEGVRGIDAYRETWPSFLRWQTQKGVFEIETLDVTAGDDVAFAHALVRCGEKERLTEEPRARLRLTLGLRRRQGRWVVAHEHHSFPLVEPAPAPEVTAGGKVGADGEGTAEDRAGADDRGTVNDAEDRVGADGGGTVNDGVTGG
ncbi:YybH family protein [Streptosporangium sp. NPDC050855]|uniref:YybH family protein n=1 Tax=Streptosporangium sp. NPDC050855 TaxID=3366194 RepID=UPI0037B482A5